MGRPGATRKTATLAGFASCTVTCRGRRSPLRRGDFGPEVVVLAKMGRLAAHAAGEHGEQRQTPNSTNAHRTLTKHLREDPQSPRYPVACNVLVLAGMECLEGSFNLPRCTPGAHPRARDATGDPFGSSRPKSTDDATPQDYQDARLSIQEFGIAT